MNKDFWKNQEKPIVVLSPMDGYTDSPYRRICKEITPDIFVFTEFTSTDGLYHAPEKVRERLRFENIEQPAIAQIYGKNLEMFVRSVPVIEEMGFAGIDLNMGCPAKKVVKSEQGVALRKHHDIAAKLVEAVSKATDLPVSVKTRLGWNDASDLTEFGKKMEDAGCDLITIHGRTYVEPYGVPAQFDPIYELKDALSIPVLGNGGITDVADGIKKLGNLDGFMIGQAAIGNPWVFTDKPQRDMLEKIPVIRKHALYMEAFYGPELAPRVIRKHLLAYIKGFHGASAIRGRLATIKSIPEIMEVLDELAESLRQA
jgi:nifR3 family TIM-barrel protein